MTARTSSPAVLVAGQLARMWRAPAVGFWVAIVAIMAAVTIGVDRWGTVERSAWDAAAGAPRIFVLVLGMLAAGLIDRFVNHGVTRRDVVAGTMLWLVPIAGLYAALSATAYGVEALVFDRLGWSATIEPGRLYDSGSQVGLILLDQFPVMLAHGISGVLWGLAWRRWHAWAVVGLPVLISPFLVVQWLLATGSEDWLRDLLGLSLAGAAPLVAVVLAAFAGAALLIARGHAVRAS